MRRRVITMNEAALSGAARRLEELVASTGYEPDAVLSIKTGGEYVGTLMFTKAAHVSTCLQRPGTRHKGGWKGRLLRWLPRGLCNRLRIIEAWWLSRRRHEHVDPLAVQLPDIRKYERLLIVDDSVDSGATLDAVRRAVKLKSPQADVLTAVITVTTRKPLVFPDFSLYNNLTLIRFPWSIDNRHRRE